MKTLTWLLAILASVSLLAALGTGLGMRSLGIWAFQLHKVVGSSSVILGLGMAIWSVCPLLDRKPGGLRLVRKTGNE